MRRPGTAARARPPASPPAAPAPRWGGQRALAEARLQSPAAGRCPSQAQRRKGNKGVTCLGALSNQRNMLAVEVIPNYQSLKGSPMLTEVVIPPTVEYITSCTLEKSLEKLAPTYSILLVEWPSHDFGIVN